ncbi:SOS response-associated peptidase [Flavobacterium piscinae]|uniref:SOS response-associated peptidase n=1 Tax=Flavobacterium piscinae TaxID=2506424 RepID=UPI002AABD910|nr:SOS response-associated peptidase family protein [Flavobacterium piscinae]
MCFYMAQKDPIPKVEKRFKARVDQPEQFLQSDYIIGFEFRNVPIILNTSPEIISTNFHWGLVPSWAKDVDIRKNTLNARMESLEEKPSFANVTTNRRLVIASSFFEWHWNDEKGKSKDKYEIFSAQDELFAMAGLYDTWLNPQNGTTYNSFTIVTTARINPWNTSTTTKKECRLF